MHPCHHPAVPDISRILLQCNPGRRRNGLVIQKIVLHYCAHRQKSLHAVATAHRWSICARCGQVKVILMAKKQSDLIWPGPFQNYFYLEVSVKGLCIEPSEHQLGKSLQEKAWQCRVIFIKVLAKLVCRFVFELE